MNRLLAILAPALTLAACSTPLPPAPTASPAPQVAAPAPPSLAVSPPAPVKPVALVNTETPMQTFERTDMALSNRSIYFDYDKYAIKPNVDGLISQHAKLLESYPQDYLTLQGNCDERGSSEYNLALGQRRADAVKERLVLLGVPAARIETVSFGKEKPRLTCHDEKCWQENRRADFVDAWK
jgi:peptidoglycan-associated lipoprotein